LTLEYLAGIIDHTFLRPYGSPEELERHCEQAVRCRFATVAVHPCAVETCVRLLRGTGVGVGAAVGFPLGQNTTASKMFEIADALGRGATEIDMVINIRELQAGRLDVVRQEIGSMVRLCRKQKAISKVILETCYLNEAEKLTVCRLAREESADFVKTSTGFGSDGAKVEDVALMRRAVGPHIGVKASGGVHTLQTALAMIEAGATRIGTSHGVEIVRQFSESGLPA